MDENNENKNDTNVNAEEIKNELKETTAEVKEAVKNTNLKKDANEAKNFIINFFKTPYTELKKVVTTPKSFLKIAIIVFVVWVVIEALDSIISVISSISYSPYYNIEAYVKNSISDFFSVIKAIIIPVISVALISGIIYLLMRDKKKNYLSILTTIIIAKIPVVLASIISLLNHLGSKAYMITSSISSICSVFSTILIYFTIKAFHSDDDDDKSAKTFLITMAIYYGIALILKFFNLYI